MAQLKCDYCKKEFSHTNKKKKYCSNDCLSNDFKTRLAGKNNPNYRHGPKHCQDCGAQLSKNAKKWCLSCRSKNQTGNKNPFFGKKHSKEFKLKMSETWHLYRNNAHWINRKHSDKSKEKMSASQKEFWKNSSPEQQNARLQALADACITQLNFKPTVPENRIAAILDQKGIKYQRNVPLYGKFIVDFLLDDGRIVEVFGDYWHGNPAKYPTPDKTQLRQQHKDKSRLAYLKKCKREVIVIWENRVGRRDYSIMENEVNRIF